MEARALTEVLSAILEQAAATGLAVLTADRTERWPEGVVEQLAGQRLLVRSTNERGMTCDGCEDACWVEPELRRRADGSSVLVHACEHREDIGLVELDAKRLASWRLDFAALAAALASSLHLSGSVEEIVVGRTWRLGERRVQGRRQVVFFAHGLTLEDGQAVAAQTIPSVPDEDSLLLVPSRKPSPQIWPRDSRGVATIADAIQLGAEGLVLPLDGLAAAKSTKRKIIVRPFASPTGTTWEKVVIRVLDEERAELQVGHKKETRTFANMGMRDARRSDDEPNAAWAMLLVLARNGGELGWSDEGASDRARAHMKLLRSHLRELFGIEDDPIKDYKSKRRWRTKFALVDQRADR